MQYWLVKSEPETYSWEDLVKEKKTAWTGIRNYQARNDLRLMKKGDQILFYYSGKEKAVVGIAEVVKEAYQDPTTTEDWSCVDIAPKKKIQYSITLQAIKAHPALQTSALVTHSRLSVIPLKQEEYKSIIQLGKK